MNRLVDISKSLESSMDLIDFIEPFSNNYSELRLNVIRISRYQDIKDYIDREKTISELLTLPCVFMALLSAYFNLHGPNYLFGFAQWIYAVLANVGIAQIINSWHKFAVIDEKKEDAFNNIAALKNKK